MNMMNDREDEGYKQFRFTNEYFEDEVRDGFFVPSLIKQEWAAGLEILNEIDKVCQNHNIQYFADWGTLLATVRHKGYIPWDDDLDITMKREDYRRFCEIAPDELPDGFEIHNFQNHRIIGSSLHVWSIKAESALRRSILRNFINFHTL